MSEARVRFDVVLGTPVDFGKMPPIVIIRGYPPHEGEGQRDYHRRVEAQIMREIFEPKPSLAKRIVGRLFGRVN